jgi:hypothetical protein
MDPAYKDAIVEEVATELHPMTGDKLLPPDGCMFVRVKVGGTNVLLTLQEGMFEGPGPQSEYRVTPEMVNAEVTRESYSLLPSGKAIVCELTLRNEYTVRGASAVVDITNFNYEMGCQVARRKAYDRVYVVLSFRLQDALHRERRARGIVTQ